MPNWTDDEGNNWFGILECKRCLQKFEMDEHGEVPPHDCLGGRYKSVSTPPYWHQAVPCEEARTTPPKVVTAEELWEAPEQIEILLVCSVRYALGRRSYIVSDVCDIVEDHLPLMNERTRHLVAEDIRNARDTKQLGSSIDAPHWLKLLAKLEEKS